VGGPTNQEPLQLGHREAGASRIEATLTGAREVSFTVVSMSVSLVAVFLPILLLGDLVGRLFREFAIALSIAIGVSLLLALTTTPMMCSLFLRQRASGQPIGRLPRAGTAAMEGLSNLYARTLRHAIEHPVSVLMTLFLTIGLSILLFTIVPKGLFPQQDNGLMLGGIEADESILFQAMRQKLQQAHFPSCNRRISCNASRHIASFITWSSWPAWGGVTEGATGGGGVPGNQCFTINY